MASFVLRFPLNFLIVMKSDYCLFIKLYPYPGPKKVMFLDIKCLFGCSLIDN
jgi:hypothetical protein